MNQEFVVQNMSLIEDEENLSITVDDEVIATFKYHVDALNYFTRLINNACAPVYKVKDK